MKLKKFNKNKKVTNKLIIGIIIIMGLIIGVDFIKSHAYFEMSKTYNVIEGKIPNFAKGDIQFAVLLDGEESGIIPKQDSGYHFAGSECTNDATAIWSESNWNVSINNLKTTGTVCTLKFKKVNFDSDFNYGDGSQNTISRTCTGNYGYCTNLSNTNGGYVDKLYVYDLATGIDTKLESSNTYYTGNYNDNIFVTSSTKINNNPIYRINGSDLVWQKGENEFSVNAVGDNKSTVFIDLHFHNSGYIEVSNLKIDLDGTYYTLEEAVNSKKIKPLVLVYITDSNTNWLGDNPINLYNGGKHTGIYGLIYIYFMLEEDVYLRNIKVSVDKDLGPNSANFYANKLDAILHL